MIMMMKVIVNIWPDTDPREVPGICRQDSLGNGACREPLGCAEISRLYSFC